MGRAKNTLNAADVSSTPIKFRYTATYSSASFLDYGITAASGSNIPYSVTMSSDQMDSMNKYRMIKQFYYQQAVSGSALNSSSFWEPFWVSTAASGTLDSTDYTFPTASYDKIVIFAIPSNAFGEQVARKSFRLTTTGVGSQFDIVDDGNGNLFDSYAGSNNVHVGNIFYGQGIAVITNSDYIIPPAVIENMASQLDEPLITQADDNIII